ncbi:hypothetical protein KKB18_05525, partial [bacterium]|nr:hypothetical protein [bacterium]
IASNKMVKYAQGESTELAKNCNTTSTYLDLNAGNNPMTLRQIDLALNDKNSNTFKLCVEDTKDFFQFMRNVYHGPVVGEGGIGWGRYDTFYAGYIDGVDRLPERETYVFVVPEHELRVIKPLQVNYGMGRYDRFFVGPKYPPYNKNFNLYDFDHYRTLEIAFGHGGYIHVDDFVGRTYTIYHTFCREYYMMQQLQSRYLPSDIVPLEILYFDDGEWISQDELILRNRSLEDVLLKISYSNGLDIWINQKDTEYIWEPNIYNGITLPIPQNGFVALKTEGEVFLECSIVLNEERVDYVCSDAYIFAENRDHVMSDIGYITTDGQAVLQKNPSGNTDVHLLQGTHITDNLREKKIIDTSFQCHINIIYNNSDEFVMIAPYIFNPGDLTVTYYDFPSSWLGDNGKLPEDFAEHLQIYKIKDGIEQSENNVSVSTLTDSELIFENIALNTRYLVRYDKK